MMKYSKLDIIFEEELECSQSGLGCSAAELAAQWREGGPSFCRKSLDSHEGLDIRSNKDAYAQKELELKKSYPSVSESERTGEVLNHEKINLKSVVYDWGIQSNPMPEKEGFPECPECPEDEEDSEEIRIDLESNGSRVDNSISGSRNSEQCNNDEDEDLRSSWALRNAGHADCP